MKSIIKSLLDTDFYKFTMGQYAWKYYPDVRVKYAFKNRTKSVELGNIVNKHTILEQLNRVRTLRFSMEDLNYLKSLGIFSNDYLGFLNTLTLPPVFVDIKDGELIIETEGKWPEAIFWETFILSIVNELYCDNSYCIESGLIELDIKIETINKHPFKFVDFGTRRRRSQEWHETVVTMLKNGITNDSFIGTSNVYLAKKFDLKPIGTFAHELPMVVAGYYDEFIFNPDTYYIQFGEDRIRKSHYIMLRKWYELYEESLSIALTDTFGSKFFFEDFKYFAKDWKGLRQDSGDPFEFANKALKFYREQGINPKDKVIIFSDGLDVDKILKLEKECKNHFKTAYGWGTNLTNDMGYKPLSIVVKAVEANGKPLVKLSDNLAKAVGTPEAIERYQKIFGYIDSYHKEPVY